MGSDHYPIMFNLRVSNKFISEISSKIRLNLEKADWLKFRNTLEAVAKNIEPETLGSLTTSDISAMITEQIIKAAEESIPKVYNRSHNSLPSEIVDVIKSKREVRKLIKKNNNLDQIKNLKSHYNSLTRLVKELITKFKQKSWDKFLETLGDCPTSSRLFWQKINEARSAKQSSTFPTLVADNKEYKTTKEKIEIFSELLSKTFSEEALVAEFDQKHKAEVDKVVSEFKFNSDDFIPYNTGEIIKTINKIHANTSPGEDQVQNIFLKHLPFEYVSKMLSVLVNRVVTEGIPQTWKEAKITMIPKKEGMSRDPEKYRPISLTSCLGKLVERLIKKRLYGMLEANNVIVKQQSGFRNEKGAADNLVFFTQKISETINRGKKALGIFFDISKAFDKVWHNGLLKKLIDLKIPNYILNYLKDFLNNRFFRINIDGYLGEACKITCSVPQGSVLGPLLFLVYINDIPLTDSKSISYSSLFADDLVTIFMFNKPEFITHQVNRYLENLVAWQFKWRLKMNSSKCCYTIFSGGGNKTQIKFTCKLKDGIIPYNPKPIFLGITFDEHLCSRVIRVVLGRGLLRG